MFKVEFTNFSPESHLETDAQATLKRISEMAPYGSYCKGVIEKSSSQAGEGFTAQIEIRSRVGNFNGRAQGPSVRKALDRAEWQVQDKLAYWRKNSFRDRFGQDDELAGEVAA